MHARLTRIVPLVSLLAVCAFAPMAPAEDLGSPEFLRFRDKFLALSLDSTRVFHARNVLLERVAASFLLEDGQVVWTPVVGPIGRAAVFTGRGTFAFTPANDVEREQLRRSYGVRSLRVKLRSVTFFFTDSTGHELAASLEKDSGPMSPKARQTLREARRYLLRTEREALDPDAALALLETPDAGWFWAHVVGEDGRSYFFALNPWQAERVQLMRPPDNDQMGLYRRYEREVVCQFTVPGDSLPQRDDRPNLVVEDVAMNLAFDAAMKGRNTVTLRLRGVARESRWFAALLHGSLEVESFEVEGLPPVKPPPTRRTYREDQVDTWWIALGEPLRAGETRTVRVTYAGPILDRQTGLKVAAAERDVVADPEEEWLVFHHPLYWYPYPLFSNRSTWDLSFRVPREYPLVASGERIDRREDGLFVESRWVTRDPAYLASFNVDFMRGIEVTDAVLKPLQVWFHDPGRSGRVESFTTAQLADARGSEAAVARDVARALQFYTTSIGPPRVRQLSAVESPLTTYLAFPGLVHMMRKSDQLVPGPAYSTDFLRAHELAHQWWGYGVTPRTYHDVWLNEAFADFSAMWYLQAGRGDVNSYFQILRSRREFLLENRKFIFGPGQQAGPIWLGSRNESSTTPGDYSLIVYRKGAWVLHMLRNVLLDVGTGDDSRFRDAMQRFYRERSGGYASTEDFRATVEAVAGEDLGWFFDQWVYGTDVPKYEVTSETVQSAPSQWQVKLRVKQSGTSEKFRMPVLVRLDFGEEQYARTRVWVQGPLTEVTLPAVSRKPTKVVFNDLESVLCELETRQK